MKALALVFLLFATTLTFDTTKLPDGGSDAKLAGGRRVTVEKHGHLAIVRVEEGERVDTIRMSGGKISAVNNGKIRPFTNFERPRVVVDGVDLEPYLTGQAPSQMDPEPPANKRRRAPMEQREYICPKDGAVLRVPTTARQQTYKCPVDGTPMEAGVGPGLKFYRVE